MPERYDGCVVYTMGYFRKEFEGHAIFLSEEHAQRGVEMSAIRVGQPLDAATIVGENGDTVGVVGTFEAPTETCDHGFGTGLIRPSSIKPLISREQFEQGGP